MVLNKCPLVSIIIPNYNSEKYIAESIKSCIGQTYSNIEIIVVDDASNDGSLSIVREFDGVRIYQNPENKGACYSRNYGIQIAKGKYLKFLDADDILVNDSIERQVLRNEELGEIDICYGDFAKLINGKLSSFGNNILIPGSLASTVYFDVIHTTAPLHRKKLLCQISGFDERLRSSQEWNMHIRLTANGVNFHYYPDDVVMYRIYESDTRISTNRYKNKDYAYEIEKILMTYESVAECCDEDARAAFSYHLWAIGRKALQDRNKKISKECFSKAVEISPRSYKKYWKRRYRIVQTLLGEINAENIFVYYRDIRDASMIS